ncbi:MAG: leucine-rich repeat domain-containing protein, partial [Paludibacter sp.]
MRRRILNVLFLCIVITFNSCNEDSIFNSKVSVKNGKTIVMGIHTGGLENALFLNLSFITHLEIVDTIDARDFKTMRDLLPNLQVLDLSKAVIVSYNGYEGCGENRIYRYKANKIPEFAFYSPTLAKGKSSLQTIIFPQSINSIGDYAFTNCLNLKGTLEFPASVTDTIGRQAFSYCSQLTGLKLSGVKYIGESAFHGCSNLSGTLIIPDSVLSIQLWAFAYCDKLQTVQLSSTVSEIVNLAFYNCPAEFTVDAANQSFTSLNGILFNADKSTIFQYPTGKKGGYILPQTVTTIGKGSFANCTEITSIVIPDGTSIIEDYAFSGCTKLAGTVKIASGVFSIGMNVFENCNNITSIELPASLAGLGDRTFYNCSSLHNIYMSATVPLDMSY